MAMPMILTRRRSWMLSFEKHGIFGVVNQDVAQSWRFELCVDRQVI